MQVFVAITALLAVASAGHLGLSPYSYSGLVHGHFAGAHYAGAQHIPVIGANGVPVDEPAVAIAKANHAAAHVEAVVRNGDAAQVGFAPVGAYGVHVAAPVAHYAGPQHLPVIGANGVPVDEPAVSAARAHHAAAHVEAKVRNGDAAVFAAPLAYAAGHIAAPVSAYAAHFGGPVAGHAVPLDTPEVAAAKAAHFAAHVDAKVRNGAFHHYAPLVHYRKRRGVFHGYAAAPFAAYAAPVAHYAGAQHIPVIGANGVPVDEPAVAIAKAEHAAAHIKAVVRNGDAAHVGFAPVAGYAAHVAAPVAHYAGPQHLPVIGANGVPVDEPAVSAARAHHAAAHVEAQVRNGDAAVVAAGHFAAPVAYAAGHFGSPLAYAAGHIAGPVVHYAGAQHVPVIGANGVPVDEPAVAVAKAHHAAAHVEAKVRNGDLHHVVAPVLHAW